MMALIKMLLIMAFAIDASYSFGARREVLRLEIELENKAKDYPLQGVLRLIDRIGEERASRDTHKLMALIWFVLLATLR